MKITDKTCMTLSKRFLISEQCDEKNSQRANIVAASSKMKSNFSPIRITQIMSHFMNFYSDGFRRLHYLQCFCDFQLPSLRRFSILLLIAALSYDVVIPCRRCFK